MNTFIAQGDLSGHVFIPAGTKVTQPDLVQGGFDVRRLMEKKAILPAAKLTEPLPGKPVGAESGGGLEDLQARIAAGKPKPKAPAGSQPGDGSEPDWKTFIRAEINRARDELLAAIRESYIPSTVDGIEPESVELPKPPANPFTAGGVTITPEKTDVGALSPEQAAADGQGSFT